MSDKHVYTDPNLDTSLGRWFSVPPRVLSLVAVIGIVFLMLATGVDVLWRSTLGTPIPGVQDYSAIALAIVVFAGIAEGQRKGSHVHFELIDKYLPRRVLIAVTIIGYIGVLVFLSVFFLETLELAMKSIATNEYRLGIVKAPMWPARLAMPIGLAMLMYVMVMQVISMVFTLFNRPLFAPAHDETEKSTES